MERPDATAEIRNACTQIASAITSIHPLVQHLQDAPTQGEIFKALFELTKHVETVKKQLMRLEKRDDSTLT
jgi:hypothetical protein